MTQSTADFNRPPILPPHLIRSARPGENRADPTVAKRDDHATEQQPKPIDGTEEMTHDEQKSAGIVDDAGRKVPPTTAFLLVAMLFIFGIAIVILALVLVAQIFSPLP